MKQNNKFQYSTLTLIVLGIQLLASLVVAYFTIKINLLPTKYVAIILLVLVLFFVLFVLVLRGRKDTLGKNIGKIVSLLISIAMIFVSFQYLQQGDAFLSKITGGNIETHVVSVYVLNDSPLQKVEELSGKQVAESKQGETDYLTQAKDDINKKLDTPMVVSDVNTYEDLMNALYDGEADAILLNDSHLSFVELFRQNFSTETRVLYQYEKTEASNVQPSNKNVTKDTFTIYLSGIDTFGPVSTVSRSDVNMLLTVNPKTKQILMVSIPRDYYVTLATKKAKDKLTHSGIYGINETIMTVENLLSIDIDFYARVNFTSVTEVVDALGGVTVNSEFAFTTLWNGYKINKGSNDLNGDQALGFVRERYSLPNGDNDRVKNQQALLTGILKKAMSPKIITNYSQVLNSVSDSLDLSISSNDLSELIKMQLNDGGNWDIQSYSLKGTGTSSTNTFSMPGYNLYVMEPNMSTVNQATEYINRMISGETISIPK